MADRHDYKVGNRGDVWKHFVLCSVADSLIQKCISNKPFVYADTHCSLGRFPLPEHGEWQRGIGPFYGRQWSLSDHFYFRTEQEAYKEAQTYLGSWKLIERLLAVKNTRSDLRLFDTSDIVAEQLRVLPGFSHSDGFDGILSCLSADLCFVDPAYSDHRERDWTRIRRISMEFSEQSAAALLWYPLFVKERHLDHFRGVIAEVRWPASGANQRMRGCGVIALGSASGILQRMQSSLVQLAEALSGSLCVRDQRA